MALNSYGLSLGIAAPCELQQGAERVLLPSALFFYGISRSVPTANAEGPRIDLDDT